MELLLTGGLLVAIVVVFVVLLFGGLLMMFAMRAWIKVARADEALVVSGKTQRRAAGGQAPVSVIVNGKALVNPLTQRHEVISLRSRQVSMRAEAQSEDNVTLSVEAVALVKIGSEPDQVRKAAQRFASQDKAIENFTRDQLEGVLRGIIAQQTVVSLMRDRKKFSEEIAGIVTPELEKQGLVLDSFQIRGITDGVGYIASLGAPEIEAKRQAAEIAQTNAERAIAKEQIANEEKNLVEQTALESNRANADAQVGKARAEAEQAEALAKAEAEQRVLQQRAENRQAELDADVKRVADAEKYRREQAAQAEAFERMKQAEADAAVAAQEAKAVRLRAEADADAIRLAGEAKAAAIKAEAEALRENQDALLAQRALEQLPLLMTEFAKGYERIGSITVVGGAGSAGEQFADESGLALASVLERVKAATGLDLAEVIQGRAVGRGLAEGSASAHATTAQGTIDDLLGAAGASVHQRAGAHLDRDGATAAETAAEETAPNAADEPTAE